jgi:cytochrome oxidase assembly protein ShyY1
MLSIKRKIIFTILTSPFAYVTYKAYKWQTRRKQEKIIEVKDREYKLNLPLFELNSENINLVNNDWEFRPVSIKGEFKENLLHVNKTKDSQPGYHILSPFKLQKENNANGPKDFSNLSPDQVIIVDRGWLPFDFEIEKIKNNDLNKTIELTGVFYKGDQPNKYLKNSTDEDASKNRLFYMNPETIANFFKLEGINKEFIFKIINFNHAGKIKSQLYPIIMNKRDLLVWTISPQRHQDYANFWLTVTTLNVLTNVILWLFL